MTYQVDIQSEVAVPERINRDLELAISTALQRHATPSAALTMLLTDDRRMQQLNQDFRDTDQTTDVLSFPAGDSPAKIGQTIPYLGDIAISVPVARNQAQESGHALITEIQLLAVHGVLHLLGFDHVLPEDKTLMWSAQEEILNLIGLRDVVPTEV